MARTYRVESDEDRAAVRLLFWEYLQWANGRVSDEFGIRFDIETIVSRHIMRYNPVEAEGIGARNELARVYCC